jgi:hypothetical protein
VTDDSFEEADVHRDGVFVGTEGLAGFELENVVGQEVGRPAGFSADVVVGPVTHSIAPNYRLLHIC